MSSAGHTTLSALDGEQGLQIVREKSVDLVVLDIMLPKRTGLEVLKELRRTSNIPVLMLTALDDEPTQAASFDEQADDYITKPFSMLLLGKRVTVSVDDPQNMEEIISKVKEINGVDWKGFSFLVDNEDYENAASSLEQFPDCFLFRASCQSSTPL